VFDDVTPAGDDVAAVFRVLQSALDTRHS
jgi:hypothetical protein